MAMTKEESALKRLRKFWRRLEASDWQMTPVLLDLAAEVGVNRTTLYRWVNEDVPISRMAALALLDSLRIVEKTYKLG